MVPDRLCGRHGRTGRRLAIRQAVEESEENAGCEQQQDACLNMPRASVGQLRVPPHCVLQYEQVAFRQRIGTVATGARAGARVFEATCRRVHVFLVGLMIQRVTPINLHVGREVGVNRP